MDLLVAETLFRDILITFSLFVIHLNLVMGIRYIRSSYNFLPNSEVHHHLMVYMIGTCCSIWEHWPY
jgi:hypothetical protein